MPDSNAKKQPVPRSAWLTLVVCAAAAALLQMDGTIVTVALPSVGDEFGTNSYGLAWVLTAYFVSYGLMLFPGGSMVDRIGSRRTALIGLGIFACGALLGAISGSLGVLIGSRIVQGAGAGLVSPASLAGAVSGFPPERRGAALGIWGASSGMANLIGPLIGGLLTVGLDWRACWWFFVPATAAVAWAVYRYVPSQVRADETPETAGLRQRVIAASALIASLTFLVMIGSFFLAQQYLQSTAGYSALGAAAALTVIAVLVGVAAPLAGRLCDVRGERPVAMLGWLLAGVGLAALGIPGVPLHGPTTVIMLLPFGLGLGLLFVPASRAALNAVPISRHGRVSSLLSTARLLGAALGSILAGAALANGVSAHDVHVALLIGAAICLLIGIPASMELPSAGGRASPATPPA